MMVQIFRYGPHPDVDVLPASSMASALKAAYVLMRVHPNHDAVSIIDEHILRWWMRDRDGVWQPQ